MGWFGRKDGKNGGGRDEQPPESKDPALPMLSVQEAGTLRALVREVAAEQGREVTVLADHVVDDSDNKFGLWNLAAVCAGEDDRRAWRSLVTHHFDSLFRPRDPPLEQMTEQQILASVHLRLIEEDAIGSLGNSADYALGLWAPGVLEALVIDTPTQVLTPRLTELTARLPEQQLREAGYRNTLAQLDTELAAERVEHEGRWFTCVLGDSFYTASLALALPHVMARLEPGASLAEGLVFAIPYRHQLDYRIISDGESALRALMLIPRFAALGFSDSPGPISPHTYYWRDGEVTCLTRFGDDGALSVTPGPYLEALLAEGG